MHARQYRVTCVYKATIVAMRIEVRMSRCLPTVRGDFFAQGIILLLMMATATHAAPRAKKKQKVIKTEAVVIKDRVRTEGSAQALADGKTHGLTDEQGNALAAAQARRPILFTVSLGNRFSQPDSNAVAMAQSTATQNMLRPNENIYYGSGASLYDATGAFVPEPALRIECEIPFERVPFLPAWVPFTLTASLEGAFTGTTNLLGSTGNFRYQNPQANALALTDLTYSGNLTVSEHHYNLTPMVGFGVDLQAPFMQSWADMRFLMRIAGGFTMQSGTRNYSLSLNPQYVSAGSYSDTYVIQSSLSQTYAMAFLLAARGDVGFRFRIAQKLHLSLMGSYMLLYGSLPLTTLGTFGERGA
ncbi:MAG: hypothetical protein JSR44_01195, partial [Spirochaetes bacterium]|nr:hypothetical protein [Spirochaetota bacterium]